MNTLPSGCYHTDVWVSPRDWNTTTAKSSLQKRWYVQCYFFDPKYAEKYPHGFAFRRAINKGNPTIASRQAAAKYMIWEIPKLFSESGYNPITDTYSKKVPAPEETSRLPYRLPDCVYPETPFIEALEFALSELKVAKTSKDDATMVLKHFSLSAQFMEYDGKPVKEIFRRDIKMIFKNLEKVNGEFSGHKFNKYRSYLSILYNVLEDYEAVDTNIIRSMKKRLQIENIREVLTLEERKIVNTHLKNNFPSFWRLTLIYFHSGGRISELLSVKIEDVNIEKQYYKVLIKKRKQGYVWVQRVIKDIAVEFWRAAIENGNPKDFVFSKGLVPGEKQIRRDQINKRWRLHVKKKLGITADFSKLKHLNLDEITEILSAKDAARAAGHTSDVMVKTVYAVGETARQNERLKSVGNKFA